MEPLWHEPKAGDPGTQTNGYLKVVILYEDFATARLAYHACDLIKDRLGLNGCLVYDVWKFEVLRMPALREMAADEAARADFIIVASHGQGPLPAQIEAWSRLWLERAEEKKGALIVLFDRPLAEPAPPDPVSPYLECMAQQAHWEFFTYRPEEQTDKFLIMVQTVTE